MTADLAPQIPFHLMARLDELSQFGDFFISELARAFVRIHLRLPQEGLGTGTSHPEQVRQRDHNPFVLRQIHAYNPRHLFRLQTSDPRLQTPDPPGKGSGRVGEV